MTTDYDLYKKKFSFTFVEPSYGDTPSLKREVHIELADDCTYSEVADEFFRFLSGCWGYEINLDSLVKKNSRPVHLPDFAEVYQDDEEEILL